ncbi:AraC family transcriptional regulator [Myroides marinus]|uniref:AraC family transcriptional regulator n=1 Tax=Myroides marinus TaxID=703342 RepID=UPI0025771BE7|nr:AraC family transcriptional regulator [Myroides marinus]MDM1380666.1 helix-turn-helix transcriptional regulator [Myroides marinus]MDM1387956.1 helix-turn-helix transcriptional regulator [Myroides marinus]MDM1395168.1 helix-turn-helix transcriptional regulator [Myroides marinus]
MKLVQFEPLFLRHFRTEEWPFTYHNHNHYELMLISEGGGVHDLNKEESRYSGDTIYFLSPEDSHHFYIEKKTRFKVIKFLPSAVKEGMNISLTDYWDNLLSSLSRIWEGNKNNPIDIELVTNITSIVDLMIIEWEVNDKKVSELHTNLLRSVLLLMDKYSRNTLNPDVYDATKIERIQNYIHLNIHLPEKLSLKVLSPTFGFSESGFRNFFQTQMGMSVSSYINALKIELIKTRIKSSEYSLSAIAIEFGFTDSSHFTKFFKKHTSISPLEFKRGLPPKTDVPQILQNNIVL